MNMRTTRTEMELRCAGRSMVSPFSRTDGRFASFGAFFGHAFRPLQHIRKADAVVRVAVDHVDPGEKASLHKILYTSLVDEAPHGEDVVVQPAFETDLLVRKFPEKRRHQGGPEAAQRGSRAHQRDGVHRLEAYRLAHTFGGYGLHPEIERHRLAVGHPKTLDIPGETPGDPSDAEGGGQPF